jgi:hypothetical protein
MQTLPNRFKRREINKKAGFIDEKGKLEFSMWSKLVSNIQKGGNELHQSNVERQDKIYHELLEASELIQIEFWKSIGHTEEEITQLREAWAITRIKNKDTWQKDKKVARAIFKQAAKALTDRKLKNDDATV